MVNVTLGKGDSGLLHFLIGKKPDERLVAQVADLNTVAPGITEIASKIRVQLQFVFLGEFPPDFLDLLCVPDHQTEMFHSIRLQLLHFKNRHELMLAEFAPGGAFAAAQHL